MNRPAPAPAPQHRDQPTAAGYPDSGRFIGTMAAFLALALVEQLPRRWRWRLRRRIRAALERRGEKSRPG